MKPVLFVWCMFVPPLLSLLLHPFGQSNSPTAAAQYLLCTLAVPVYVLIICLNFAATNKHSYKVGLVLSLASVLCSHAITFCNRGAAGLFQPGASRTLTPVVFLGAASVIVVSCFYLTILRLSRKRPRKKE